MCGIAGSINRSLDIKQLTSDLWHRGPDEQTTFTEANLVLHHHRLSIQDIAGGKQPMHYNDLTIIFNGEIYNHPDLRKKYQLACQTHSDTETILQLYAKLGPVFLKELDGMFALVIYDKKKQQLFLARDRAGKKPLYYYHKANQFVFASELNALHRQLALQADNNHLQQFVRLGYFYKENTPYLNVKELRAGSFALVSLTDPQPVLTQWWSIHDYYSQGNKDDPATALDKVDTMLHAAVKRRVEASDLEVGSFLSGGIDSGLVTAIAKSYNDSLKTFTVSFKGEYDEAPLARLVAQRYNTSHHEIKISFDHLVNDVEKILANYGEPHFDDSAIPSYYVSREAKKYLTVILNGDGGDELFGGYRRYIPFSKIDFFKQSSFRSSLFHLLYRCMPDSKSKMNKLNYFKRLFFLGSGTSGISTYLRSTTDIFEGFETKLFKDAWQPDKTMEKEMQQITGSHYSGLKKIMSLDFENILPSALLVKIDIATMAHSLEGRSPLLSKELTEYVPSLNDKMKINGTATKYLLRKLAGKYLPAALINQPKRGFEVPLKSWVNNELSPLIGDYITSPDAFYPSLIDRQFIYQLLDHKIKVNDEKRAKMLWLIFSLEVWYKKCYKGH